ncbi:DNA-binding protein YbaB [Rhodococcus sp. OK519]|uniref:YbaB/EbfC family nucleoid-associated protein n=1 Tax=Rhodococcus sp. OK519 TaxID=2135729 RepID=UPI000D3737F3|nr:DNA-binding protein YbaB [Rhodococcus sp. OK519]
MSDNGAGSERRESRLRLRERNAPLRGQVDAMLERLHEQTAALAAAQGAVASLTAEGASPDGLVRVTVDASGTVVSTRLDPAAFSRTTPERLADSFASAAQVAAHEARSRTGELMEPVAAMAADFPDLSDLVPGAPSIRNLVPTVATEFAPGAPQEGSVSDTNDLHDWRAPILREAHRG